MKKIMEREIYQILKKHKLTLKKREEVLADLLLLFSDAESLPEHECKYCGIMTTQSDEECYKAP